MVWLRIQKIMLLCFGLCLAFYGLWLVVSNQTQISLNLLFIQIDALNSGLAVVISFVVGCLFGILTALFIWGVIPLRWQLRQTHKELSVLRKQTVRPPVEP